MSIDDTPEVKWSNAWWYQWTVGIFGPVFLIGFSIYGLHTGRAYAVARGFYTLWFVPVRGFQATLMSLSYLAWALAAFAHGYARYHKVLACYYELLLAAGLVPAAILMSWCSLKFLTG